MSKRVPVFAIFSLLAMAACAAAPAAAQPVPDPAFLPAEENAPPPPPRVHAPDFELPVPFFAIDPPRLPAPVKAMIEAAIRSDDSAAVAAVVKVALATQPYDTEEIRAMHRDYLDSKALALAQMTKAQTERIRQSGVLELWKGQVELGAFRSTGNTSNFGFTGGVKLDRKGIDWQHMVELRADYQKDSGAVTREQYRASYQPRFTLNDGIFSYARFQYEKDEIQGFRDRYTFSGGLGYRAINRRNMTLALELGPAARRTVFVQPPAQTTWSTLTSLDFDWKVNDSIALSEDASAYVGSDNSTFTTLTALEAGMARGLKARLSYAIEHETSPPFGALKTDTISRFSLVYGF